MTLKGKNINCVLSACLLFSWTTASINSLYISEQMKSATQTKVKNSLLTWMTFHNSESIKMLKSCSCFINYFLFSCFFGQHLFFKLQDELSQHHINVCSLHGTAVCLYNCLPLFSLLFCFTSFHWHFHLI